MTGRSDAELISRLLSSSEPLFQRAADDEEYEALMRHLKHSGPGQLPRRATALLVFVGLFIRREVYRRGRGLWQMIWDRLEMEGAAQTPTLYDAIERALERDGIQVIRTDTRRFVETFWREVGITPATLNDLLALFHWYYDRYYPDREFSEALFEKWPEAGEFTELKNLMVEAVQRLTLILESLQDPDCPFVDGQGAGIGIRAYLQGKLGFDPYRVLPTDHAIWSFYLDSLRLLTPGKMKQLAAGRAHTRIVTPDGTEVWGHDLSAWSTLPLGEYTVGDRTYQVTPHPRAAVETMISWPNEKLHYPYRGYVVYRSPQRFSVTLDEEDLEPFRFYRNRRAAGYIWMSRIPTGRSLVIDGQVVRALEGVEWQPTLRLWRPGGERPPQLYVDVSSLRINYEQLQGREITVRCVGQELKGRLSAGGSVWLRGVTFDLAGFEEQVEVEVSVGDQLLSTRTVSLNEAMLFAESTGSQVSTKRSVSPGSWFYLFSKEPLPDSAVQGGQCGERWEWGQYNVVKIRRTHGEFSIEGAREWHLFEEEFLSLSLERPDGFSADGDDDLYTDIAQWSVRGVTNVRAPTSVVLVELLQKGVVIWRHQHAQEFVAEYGETRRFRLDRTALPPRLPAGEYRLRVSYGELTAVVGFRLVPALKAVHGAELTYCDGERMVLTAEWTTGHRHDIETRAKVEPIGAKGLIRFQPSTVHKKLRLDHIGVTSFPVVFPVECRPYVFGVRVLESDKGPNETVHQSVLRPVTCADLVNGASLYLFGRPGAEVILIGPNMERSLRLDEVGDLMVSASFLTSQLVGSQTRITARSEDLETGFVVHWRPTVTSLGAQRQGVDVSYQVQGMTPPDIPLVVALTDVHGRVLVEAILPTDGKKQVWEGSLGPAPLTATYVRVGYREAEGTRLVALAREVKLAAVPRPKGRGLGVSGACWAERAIRLGNT